MQTTLHAPVDAGATAPFTIDAWALGATVCCLALLWWWVRVQCASRCDEWGYCPVWCRCDRQQPRG